MIFGQELQLSKIPSWAMRLTKEQQERRKESEFRERAFKLGEEILKLFPMKLDKRQTVVASGYSAHFSDMDIDKLAITEEVYRVDLAVYDRDKWKKFISDLRLIIRMESYPMRSDHLLAALLELDHNPIYQQEQHTNGNTNERPASAGNPAALGTKGSSEAPTQP